ncbi:unnamed protein product [Lymnaea stagnalis]|uniref:Rho-GAP domain-containing protein n=1 Tax=Lymnaea stagnalis TaxID=6523 RepID=A0AAV2HVA8_LYMST
MFRNVFSGCVSDRSSQAEVLRSQKLKFGASLSSALKHGYLPGPLVDILVHIAKEGVTTADVFRRPGNPNDTRRIVKRLTEGKQVIYANYSFYTLASVVKKFLLKTPGGVFTPEGEEELLRVLTLAQKMDQIEAVHNFIVKLSPAHQQLVALLFGTWFRIVTFQEKNCMSVEALSRSVAGSMFHTCAEDPAKVEKASRIMQFLIDNFGVERMFGQENIRFFAETTHTGIHIRELFRYSYRSDSQLIPRKQAARVFVAIIGKEASKYGFDLVHNATVPDFIEVTRMDKEDDDENEDCGLGRERELSESPQQSPTVMRHSDMSRDTDDPDDSQLMINVSTLSAPEVSLVPSPEVSKRPKSLEDNLNEVRSHYQSRCLSRFNSVKRKQLERLRQRSDWFLSPTVRERNNSRKGKGEGSLSLFASNMSSSGNQHRGNGNNSGKNNSNNNNHPNGSSKVLQQKNSGNSVVTKASSEGAVLEAFSDGDSVFTDNTSRSESPASEPVWSHILKVHSRDIIHSDTIAELAPPEMSLYGGSSGADLSLDSHDNFSGHHVGLSPTSVRSRFEDGERERGYEEEDDDEDNTTPTGIQEEEDTTLMTSSLPDLQQHGVSEESEFHNRDLEKELPVESNEGVGDAVMKSSSYGGSFKTTGAEVMKVQADEKEDFTNGQQTSSDMSQREEEKSIEAKLGGEQIRTSESLEEDDSELVQCFLVEHTYGDKTTDS